MEEKLLKIINHYGEEHQRNKLAEEYRELQDELYKFVKGEEEDILGELADVLVVTLQFMTLGRYNFDYLEENIKTKMNFKIDRTIGEMKNENNK